MCSSCFFELSSSNQVSAKEIFKDCPLCICWKIPTFRTNTLNSFHSSIFHHFVPLIKPAVFAAFGNAVVVAVFFDNSVIQQVNIPANHLTYVKICCHPALVADVYCWILLPVAAVGKRFAAGKRILKSNKNQFITIVCSHMIGGISPYIIKCRGIKTGKGTNKLSGSLAI